MRFDQLREVTSLSSGTMATITGETTYSAIDALIAWCWEFDHRTGMARGLDVPFADNAMVTMGNVWKVYSAEWEHIWQHFNRMQDRVMADKTTREQFFAQPAEERMEFYNWLQSQCGQFACYV